MLRQTRRETCFTQDDPYEEFRSAVWAGLSAPRKHIAPKFFYDARGSRLFERICSTKEYYPTITETAILSAHITAIAAMLPRDAVLVEFGSGASLKVRLLLDALYRPAAYVPIDISDEHLLDAARALARDYLRLPIFPLHADFTRSFALPTDLPRGPRIGFFPGSTIGNFHPHEAITILRGFSRQLGSNGRLLIGVDRKKDSAILQAAYNDRSGFTAAFNLNLLARINRELGGTFALDAFEHNAFYNAAASRIEMHLVSVQAQTVSVCGRRFHFAEGESIHTENSYKYAPAEFRAVAHEAGFRSIAEWTDPQGLFSVHLLGIDRL
ncbi:MAG: L-histidine N(alpha)-methyltransferase [Rhodospirillales bacterium]|nr:L-histidine N(alpha)-methyltransferase [Rhodospirillales bacterium]